MSAAARLIKRGDGGEAALGLSAAGATAAGVLLASESWGAWHPRQLQALDVSPSGSVHVPVHRQIRAIPRNHVSV